MGQKMTKRELAKFNLGGKVPRCPLCHAWMERMYVPQRECFVFKCDLDRIAIRVDDPFVGRWEEALEKSNPEGITCPRPGCGSKMRYFATSVGFMKAKCPREKCGATLTASEPDRKTDRPDVFYSPDKPGVLQ